MSSTEANGILATPPEVRAAEPAAADFGSDPTCAFVTFGCKINFADTQAIRESILALGFREVGPGEGSELYVVNACTVTGNAGDQGVAAVRQIARRNPQAKILVTGCMTAEDRARLGEIAGVRYLVGNEEKDQIPALISGQPLTPGGGRRSRNIFRLRSTRFDGRTRAFLKVHDGCDSFCSYCIIPFLRGKSKSRGMSDVLAEAEHFARAGHRELVLTGIHLSQYGKDLEADEAGSSGLVALIRALRSIPGVDRVRLSSIGESAFTEPFVELFRSDPGCCPFFHVPLQSGSPAVLARMRRDYTLDEYFACVERIRRELPHAFISTDLMVGFPGESDEEFEESLAACRRAAYGKIHLFPYSPRPGTRAVKLPNRVPLPVIRERMERARALERELARAERQSRIGSRVRVLVEKEQGEQASGLCREGLEVRFARAHGAALWNRECWVRVDGESDGALVGAREEAHGRPELPGRDEPRHE